MVSKTDTEGLVSAEDVSQEIELMRLSGLKSAPSRSIVRRRLCSAYRRSGQEGRLSETENAERFSGTLLMLENDRQMASVELAELRAQASWQGVDVERILRIVGPPRGRDSYGVPMYGKAREHAVARIKKEREQKQER